MPAPLSPAITRKLDTADRWALRAVTGAAMLFAVAALVSLVLRTVELLSARVLDIGGVMLAPGTPVPALAGSPAVEAASYESALLSVVDLPAAARAWLVAESAMSGLLSLGLCLIVAIVGMKLLARRPFDRTATYAIMTASILVMATGVFGQFFSAAARTEVVQFLGEAGEAFSHFVLNFDPAPFAYGFALAAIAAAFQLGERMQRDTEGLV